MPRLDNIRHERFAREYIKTGVGAQAYLKAGYHPSTRNALDVNACRMLRHRKVASRIAELRRQMTYKTKISLESLLSDLADDRALARELGQPSAAIAATTLAAKLTGLLVERKESGAPGDFAGLTAEQAIEQVRKDHGEAKAAALAALLEQPDTSLPDDMPIPASGALN